MKLNAIKAFVSLIIALPLSYCRIHHNHHKQLPFIRSFTLELKDISLPATFFTSGTNENTQAKEEIEKQLHKYLSASIEDVLGVLVSHNTSGRFVANVTVTVDLSRNRNAGGELSKAMLDLGQHGVSVNVSTSRDNEVNYNGVVITNGDLAGCDVRRMVHPCYKTQVCALDDGMPICQKEHMMLIDKWVIIGAVCGATAIVVLVARQIWLNRKQSADGFSRFHI